MKFIDMKHTDTPFNCQIIGDSFFPNVNGWHIEFTLSDNSQILMSSDVMYKLIDDDIILMNTQEINVEDFLENADTAIVYPTVSYNGYDVHAVGKSEVYGEDVYYLMRSGINPISVQLGI